MIYFNIIDLMMLEGPSFQKLIHVKDVVGVCRSFQ